MVKRKINWKKGLFKTSLMIFFTALITISIGFGFFTTSANTSQNIELIQVNVKPGESLWVIADRYDNNKKDLRKFIYEIKRINNIGDTIYPGQLIEIPIYK
ncbi:MAG: LysM peptidoglycan-binding domain-containing protein [Peptococcales bacterium]|jgi:nucleoid-associated protein YgaU